MKSQPFGVRFARGLLGDAVVAGLMLLGWGDVRGFFAHGARAGLILVLVVSTLAACWSESDFFSRGLREVKGQASGLLVLLASVLLFFWLLPDSDRAGLLVLPESSHMRYAGLMIYAAGSALRTWSFIYLGRFFSGFLTVQEGHRLVTRNVYAVVRHPSYTGGLLMAVGFSLIFRSLIGLGGSLLLLTYLVRRIRLEETILAREFGSAWASYRARTSWRLFPGIY